MLENIIIGQSLNLEALSTTIGKIKTVIANTNAIFAMFEPITLLIAISGVPFKAAFKLTISSGAEVPNATIVKPIASSETWCFFLWPSKGFIEHECLRLLTLFFINYKC